MRSGEEPSAAQDDMGAETPLLLIRQTPAASSPLVQGGVRALHPTTVLATHSPPQAPPAASVHECPQAGTRGRWTGLGAGGLRTKTWCSRAKGSGGRSWMEMVMGWGVLSPSAAAGKVCLSALQFPGTREALPGEKGYQGQTQNHGPCRDHG